MADSEFVSMAEFGQFVNRIDKQFEHVAKEIANVNKLADERYESINQRFESMNQRFADAEKARDQNLVHVNQRFDSLEKRFDDLRTLIVVMYTPIAIAILGAVVKWFFFSD